MPNISSYDQEKASKNSLNKEVYPTVSLGEQFAPICTFSVTFGFVEILIKIVAEMFSMLPSKNNPYLGKGLT